MSSRFLLPWDFHPCSKVWCRNINGMPWARLHCGRDNSCSSSLCWTTPTEKSWHCNIHDTGTRTQSDKIQNFHIPMELTIKWNYIDVHTVFDDLISVECYSHSLKSPILMFNSYFSRLLRGRWLVWKRDGRGSHLLDAPCQSGKKHKKLKPTNMADEKGDMRSSFKCKQRSIAEMVSAWLFIASLKLVNDQRIKASLELE